MAFQRSRQQAQGQNNAQSLFQVDRIPSDNPIRQMLDPVTPATLFPVYDEVYESLREQGMIESFRAVHQTVLIALDGTWYSSSQKIHCPNCSCLEHANGDKTYYHSAVTPVIVAPGQPHALALRPEFITPQDLPAGRQAARPSRIAKSPPPNVGWKTTALSTLHSKPPCWAMTSTPISLSAAAPGSPIFISSLSANRNRTPPSTTG